MSFNLTNLTAEVLDQLRHQADPLADDVIQKVVAHGDQKKVSQLMMLLFQDSSFHKGMFVTLGDELSSTLDLYIEESAKLPQWANPQQITSGEQLFSKYGPEVFMLLNVSSLPLCYTCAKGAEVLYKTGRLLTHNGDVDPLARRLMETAQMVVNVLSEGGLSPNGKGIVTLQKVRLIHASIRYYLKNPAKGEGWDVDYYGEPINQEDLAGTLMSFGPVILNGLKNLGIELSQQEQLDYMHCWKVVGHLMGIDPMLLPDSYQEGFDLASKILRHQAAKSEAGKALTSSCIDFMNYLIPGNAFDEVPEYFIHHFLNDFSEASKIDLAECIGVDNSPSRKDKLLLSLSKWMTGKISHLEDHKLVSHIAGHFNKKLLEGIIHHFNHGKEVQFFIPPSLQKDWKLASGWKDQVTSPGVLGRRLAIQKKTNNTIN